MTVYPDQMIIQANLTEGLVIGSRVLELESLSANKSRLNAIWDWHFVHSYYCKRFRRKRYQIDRRRSPEQDSAGSIIINKGKFIEKVKLLCEHVSEH